MLPPIRSAKEIFLAALEQTDPSDRAEYLRQACGADAELRRHVEALLRVHDEPDSLLDQERIEPRVMIDRQRASAPTIDQPLERPGTQIGPYKLLQQIGEGGMGVVYMAEQTEPVQRKVALKVIKPGMDTRQVIARFEAERQALAVMDHPNIAKVLDAGTVGQVFAPHSLEMQVGNLLHAGRPYFVMELVRGIPITQYCDENQLRVRERLALFATVCQAIQHAHTKGIIHRDIKPTNVLVTRQDGDPIVKVIDFGVAKAMSQQLTDKTLFTEFAQMIGTPLYMSPEQVELSSTDIDTRSDIYSLGVLLYELLTGTTPVSKEQLKQAAFDEIRRIIREDEPPRPSTRISTAEAAPSIAAQRQTEPAKLAKLVRGELDWIVMKALEKDRNRRYETANGLAQDLQRYLANEPVQACPPSAGYRLQKFVSRNRGPVLAATLVLLALVAGIIGTTWGMFHAEHARRDAVAAQDAEAKRAAGERRANEEAHKRLAQVEKGTEILASVFRDLNPLVAFNTGVTARDLLGSRLCEAARKLEGEAVGDPLVVARLQHLLGILLRDQGHVEQAELVLVTASRTRERLLGADDPNTVETKHDLAMLYHFQGKHAPAEALYKVVLASRTAHLGADDIYTACTQYDLAMLYRDMKKVEQAIPLLEEAVKRCKATEHYLTLGMQAKLGALYCDAGRFGDAIGVLEEVHEKGRTRPELAWVGNALLTAYVGAGKTNETVALAKEQVRNAREQFPEGSLELAAALASTGQALMDVGANADAEPLYQEVLAIRITRLGADHDDTILPRDRLAQIYRSLKKPDQSIPLLQASLDLRKGQLAPDHGEILGRQVTLGGAYCDAGRFADGIALIENVRQQGRQDPHPAWVRTVLLTAYVQAGKRAEATALVAERVQEARREFSVGSRELAVILSYNGKVLLDVEAYVDAEPLLVEAYQGLKQAEDEKDRLRNVRQWLIELYDAWGKPDEAAKWRKNLEAARTAAGAKDR